MSFCFLGTFLARGVRKDFTMSENVMFIFHPPRTSSRKRTVSLSLKCPGHSSTSSAATSSWSPDGGGRVGGGVMSQTASAPGWNISEAAGAASLPTFFPPMNNISSRSPASRSPLYWRFFKQNTWSSSETETTSALGACRFDSTGLENFRDIFQPPWTAWLRV